MRPPSVYAKPSCPAADPCDLLVLLHGPHRIACRTSSTGARRLPARLARKSLVPKLALLARASRSPVIAWPCICSV